MKLRALGVCASAAVLALLVLPSVGLSGGGGPGTPFKTRIVEITIVTLPTNPAISNFTVKVGSERKRCRRDRKVTVSDKADPNLVLADGRTNRRGRFREKGPRPPEARELLVNVIGFFRCEEASKVVRAP
jgi:hypothetical protein